MQREGDAIRASTSRVAGLRAPHKTLLRICSELEWRKWSPFYRDSHICGQTGDNGGPDQDSTEAGKENRLNNVYVRFALD